MVVSRAGRRTNWPLIDVINTSVSLPDLLAGLKTRGAMSSISRDELHFIWWVFRLLVPVLCRSFGRFGRCLCASTWWVDHRRNRRHRTAQPGRSTAILQDQEVQEVVFGIRRFPRSPPLVSRLLDKSRLNKDQLRDPKAFQLRLWRKVRRESTHDSAKIFGFSRLPGRVWVCFRQPKSTPLKGSYRPGGWTRHCRAI